MQNVHWILELRIGEQQTGQFDAVMNDLIRETGREDGTLAYEYNFNDSGDVCHIYERFADARAAMVHLGRFGEHYAERFLATCSITELTVWGHPDQTVLDTLKGFKPKVLVQRAGFARFSI